MKNMFQKSVHKFNRLRFKSNQIKSNRIELISNWPLYLSTAKFILAFATSSYKQVRLLEREVQRSHGWYCLVHCDWLLLDECERERDSNRRQWQNQRTSYAVRRTRSTQCVRSPVQGTVYLWWVLLANCSFHCCCCALYNFSGVIVILYKFYYCLVFMYFYLNSNNRSLGCCWIEAVFILMSAQSIQILCDF